MHILFHLTMFHCSSQLFSFFFLFLLLRQYDFSYPVFKIADYLFCLMKSSVNTCSVFFFSFISVIMLFSSRIHLVSFIIWIFLGNPGFDPWVGKIPWRREQLPTPVFWPGEFHGLYSPRGRKESDMTEQVSLSFCFCIIFLISFSVLSSSFGCLAIFKINFIKSLFTNATV